MTIQAERNSTEAAVGTEAIGYVLATRGSEATIGIPTPWQGRAERVTVGAFLVIGTGKHRPVGMITEVAADQAGASDKDMRRGVARVDLVGEIQQNHRGEDCFQRGVAHYPAIGDCAEIIGKDGLRLIYSSSGSRTIDIGYLHHDSSIAASIDVDSLLTKHFAILGSTGVGKSSGVAVILNELLDARADLRIFLLDAHNEYGRCFAERANVINPRTFKLPFWLFNFEELVDVIYAGRPGVDEELEILSELIPIAKSSYLQLKSTSNRLTVKRTDPKSNGCTVDTPVPYVLQDLISLIDDRMGKLENRASRMNYHRLMARIETIRNDPRYAFMFENANVGGDTMAALLTQLFRLEPAGKPITVMQLAGLPAEVIDAVVCVLCRLAFDFGLWSDGAIPLLFVCEEAHRYASCDHSIGFGPTRRALSRIAKEGRKYGTYLGLVTQRPAELDPTILSQCSTMFAMRMTNDRDQALLRSAVSDAAANLLAFVPTLATREVVGFGEGVPLPARLTFKSLPANLLPRSEAVTQGRAEATDADFVKLVVERWRGSTLDGRLRSDEGPGGIGVTQEEAVPPSTGFRIDQLKSQLLKR